MSIKSLLGFFVATGCAFSAQAMSIDWRGNYRFELLDMDSTSLSTPKERKSYVLNSLMLEPHIYAADGVNIVGLINVLPNATYPGSQLGQAYGRSITSGGSASTDSSNSRVLSKTQGTSSMEVQQLYLNLVQEYGSITLGRQPVHFGLGMYENAGKGLFDHWSSSRDMIAAKFIVGNTSITPMFGRPYQSKLSQGDTMTDMMLDVSYSNPETASAVGILYQVRRSDVDTNDYPKTSIPTASVLGGFEQKNVNLFLSRDFEGFQFRMEAGFQSGNSGLRNTAGEETNFAGYGLAVEMNFPRPESKLYWQIMTGFASGDNPTTKDYEGYLMNRNYDIAMLMFNHPVGKFDVFSSRLGRTSDRKFEVADEEVMSNAFYFAPRLTYKFSDKIDIQHVFATGLLHNSPIANVSVASDIGYEYDLSVIYKPFDRMQWVNQLGVFAPGSAFQGGQGYDTKLTYGFVSKAAISF